MQLYHTAMPSGCFANRKCHRLQFSGSTGLRRLGRRFNSNHAMFFYNRLHIISQAASSYASIASRALSIFCKSPCSKPGPIVTHAASFAFNRSQSESL